MTFWQSPPAQLALLPHEIHVWQASIAPTPDRIASVAPLLSADEQARANRFYFQKDRDRFTLARGMLRLILSRYLNRPAASLQFCYSDKGKPALESADLSFNVSHSHQMALYAVADREVGIDIEQIRLDYEWQPLAARFFSKAEQVALNQLPAAAQLAGFFHCWTCKEALLKAIGAGLSIPLDKFTVSVDLDAPGLLHANWDLPPAQWSIATLSVESEREAGVEAGIEANYAAAVAATGTEWQLRGWKFEG